MEDQTRKMLNIIREGQKKSNKGLLREHDELGPVDQIVPDEFETADVGENPIKHDDIDKDELKEEISKFKDTVHKRVEFDSFKLYPESQNVEWGGKFTDSEVVWFYSLDDSTGVYITTDMLQLTDETTEVLKRLKAYYKTWGDEWADRISEEYNSLEDDDEEEGFEPGDDLPDIEEPVV